MHVQVLKSLWLVKLYIYPRFTSTVKKRLDHLPNLSVFESKVGHVPTAKL